MTASNNGEYGVYFDYSSSNTLSNVTTTNNGQVGVYFSNYSYSNALSNMTSSNNGQYGVYISSSNTLSNVTASDNGQYGVYNRSNSYNNTFTGLLKVGNNVSGNCYVYGGDGTCTNQGSSDATIITGVTLADSFAGKVFTDDIVNSSDTNGTAIYDSITDWTSFENPYRAWGKDGSDFPNADHQGQCGADDTGETCRIWDWSPAIGDTVLMDVLELPAGNDTITHTWYSGGMITFLRNAAEIMEDGIGNDNGLCESSETCLYTPNIGSYQGHGDLIDAGYIGIEGTLKDITLLQYEINGY